MVRLFKHWLGQEHGNPKGSGYGFLYEEHIHKHQSLGLSPSEARQAAVGGEFAAIGKLERDCLLSLGLNEKTKIVDLGCGSGRLARQVISVIGPEGSYLGLDVSKTLIEEACTQIKGNIGNIPFKFQVIQDCRVPCEDNSMDLLVAFSVVTHIDLEDTFSYLVEALRILRPGGRMVVSYLSADVQDHWDIFLNEGQIPYEHRSLRVRNHVFMPGMLQYLAERAGFKIEKDFRPDEKWIPLTEPVHLFGRDYAVGDPAHLGQGCLVLLKA